MSDVEEILKVPFNWKEILTELEENEVIVCGEMFDSSFEPPNMTDIIWRERKYSVPYFFVHLITTKAKERNLRFFMNWGEDGKKLCFEKLDKIRGTEKDA